MQTSDCRASSATRAVLLIGRTLAAACLAASVIGCQEYDWRQDFSRAEEQARAQGKDLFIFYKWWRDSASSDMFAQELSDPQVKALFQDTINLIQEKGFGPSSVQYMQQKYGVSTYPTSVIVRPDGRFDVLRGRVPKDEFIAWASRAKSPPSEPPAKTAKP